MVLHYTRQTLEAEAELGELTVLIIHVEGEAVDGRLSPLQEALVANHAIQCGFCTPGVVMSARGLLLRDPDPGEAAILEALGGNLCRCTGYSSILAAVRQAAAEKGGER